MSERVIEASRRPDGTVRKPVKVRAGFKSEELDIETRAYKSRGVKQKEALVGYVPGANPVATETTKSDADKRRERRQRKKKNAAILGKDEGGIDDDGEEAVDLSERVNQLTVTPGVTDGKQEHAEAGDDPKKELRKLTKLLRQIEEIEGKVKSGNNITDEQQKKLERKATLLQEIQALS